MARDAVRESRGVRRARRGLFVTFEGIEGSGKSTQLRRAAAYLETLCVPTLVTREPGGTDLGEELRRAILHSGDVDPKAELLLLFAARRQHQVEVIVPGLESGRSVLCDRYTDASRAYQGAGRRLGRTLVDDLHLRIDGLTPDRTYVFDAPAPVALARLSVRAGRDRIERESLSFHRRVRAAYRRLAAEDPRRVRLLDATRPADAVFETMREDLDRLVARLSR